MGDVIAFPCEGELSGTRISLGAREEENLLETLPIKEVSNGFTNVLCSH